MAELVDAADSKSVVERRAGSSPALGTKDKRSRGSCNYRYSSTGECNGALDLAGENPATFLNGGLAQLGEHLLCKQRVVGSIPTTSTIVFLGR